MDNLSATLAKCYAILVEGYADSPPLKPEIDGKFMKHSPGFA
jgi:hypothetical protein